MASAARSERLTEREIDATRDALARFIGIETYEAAGGGVRRDLFSDDTRGVFTPMRRCWIHWRETKDCVI